MCRAATSQLMGVILVVYIVVASAQPIKQWQNGYATYYNDMAANGRSDQSYQHCPANGLIPGWKDGLVVEDSVALGWEMLSDPSIGCGACLEIKCDPSRPLYGHTDFCADPNKVLKVIVINACPECNVLPTNCEGCTGKHLDLWDAAFAKLVAPGKGGLMSIQFRECEFKYYPGPDGTCDTYTNPRTRRDCRKEEDILKLQASTSGRKLLKDADVGLSWHNVTNDWGDVGGWAEDTSSA